MTKYEISEVRTTKHNAAVTISLVGWLSDSFFYQKPRRYVHIKQL